MPSNKILIVEDESPIRELIRIALESAGFTSVFEAADGESGLAQARSLHPDLILLDLMLPGIDGLDVCRKLKADEDLRHIPVIMLTAKSEEADIVLGLELGANDYVTKPFSRKVLIARIRTQLRNLAEKTNNPSERISNGLYINPETRAARLDSRDLQLTHGEFEVLFLFASHPGRVYTRNQIIAEIRGEGYPVTERAVDVQILNLRRKLGEWGANIETIRGVGYRLKAEDAL